MARKVLISFLGNSNYESCNYYKDNDEDTAISDIRFTPEAILRHYCTDFTTNDQVLIFVTKDAKLKAWEDFTFLEKIAGEHPVLAEQADGIVVETVRKKKIAKKGLKAPPKLGISIAR